MKVANYLDTEPMQKSPPGVVRREVIGADDGAPSFCLRVFEVAPGSSTPLPSHEHPWEHEYFIYSGRGVVVSEQGETPIEKGSVVFIAPNEHHSIANNSDEPLRFVVATPIRS